MGAALPSTYQRYIILLIIWLICQRFIIVSAIEDTDQIDDILVADPPSRVELETTEADVCITSQYRQLFAITPLRYAILYWTIMLILLQPYTIPYCDYTIPFVVSPLAHPKTL